ncbi:hypothetical protein FOA52_010118 [Chlamydomonas sp. UWO 241]|nr:hypothetical protein FOA52_010118 [Chlamydomonas sp. UWO 241]
MASSRVLLLLAAAAVLMRAQSAVAARPALVSDALRADAGIARLDEQEAVVVEMVMIEPLSVVDDQRCECADCMRAGALLRSATNDAAIDAMLGFAAQQCGGCPRCEGSARALVMTGVRWLAASWSESVAPEKMCEGVHPRCGEFLQQEIRLESHASLAAHASVGDSTTCAMCTFVVDQVKVTLNDTEVQIKVTLNDTEVQKTIMEKALEVCAELPFDLKGSCENLTKTYEPVIITWIEKVDAATLCGLAGACLFRALPAPVMPRGLTAHLADAHARLQALSGNANDACDMCQMAAIEAHSLITNPTVQADLTNYTHAMCGLFGGPFTTMCDDYVNQYAPSVFDAAEKYLNPTMCTDLGE